MSLRKRIIGAVDECAVAEDLGILCHAIIWVFSASEIYIGERRGIEETECVLIVTVMKSFDETW